MVFSGDRSHLLREVPLFSRLSSDALLSLSTHLQYRKLKPNTILFSEGDQGDRLYILVSGWIDIQKIDKEGLPIHIARRTEKDTIGEMAVLEDMPRSADAVTVTDCEVITLDRAAFLRFLKENPDAYMPIIHVLCQKVREASSLIQSERSGDALSHLVSLLLQEATGKEKRPDNSVVLSGLSVESMAHRLGITREHTSRTLMRLRQLKLVEREGRSIVLRDLVRLQKYADV